MGMSVENSVFYGIEVDEKTAKSIYDYILNHTIHQDTVSHIPNTNIFLSLHADDIMYGENSIYCEDHKHVFGVFYMTGRNTLKQDLAHTPNQVIQFYQQEAIKFLNMVAPHYANEQPQIHMLSNVV